MTQYAGSIVSITPNPAWKTFVAPPRIDTSNMPLLDLNSLPKTTLMRTLGYALTLRRGHESIADAEFAAWLCNRLPVSMIDAAGNVHVDMRDSPQHRTMFTAHIDTVHHEGGVNRVHVDGRFWRAGEGAALGADDGAGVALMCHMIEGGVPGYYLFCRGEECGGIGSTWLAKNMPEVFTDIDRAVAFDRGGYEDVITHQSRGRCCSDEFGQALSAALTTEVDWFLPSDSGIYTDTAEFIYLVPECTNISVGYKCQHGDREQLDVEFLQRLAKQVLDIQWDELPVKRDPAKREHKYYTHYRHDIADADYDLKDWPLGMNTTLTDELDDDVGTGIDEAENDLLMALEDAEAGDFGNLLDLLAEAVYPADPELGRRFITRSKITPIIIEYGMDLLNEGFPADQALQEMWQEMEVM
jgi:hypothetical protein